MHWSVLPSCDATPSSKLIALMLLVLSAAGTGSAEAQDLNVPAADSIALSVEGLPLKEALESFSTASGVGVIYSSQLVAGKTSRCSIRRSPLDAVLDCVLSGTGLRAERLSTSTYVLREEAATRDGSRQAPRRTLSGFVRDAESGEALIRAVVMDSLSGGGAVSNSYGFYSLTVSADSAGLVVSYLGYATVRRKARLDRDLEMDFELLPQAFDAGTLVVESSRFENQELRTELGINRLPARRVLEIPSLLGEPDVLRVMQLLPGVQGGNEGTAGLFVRGGSADQNLVLLDGATVYNPSHLFGFISVFNSRVLNDVTLVKGGFPARYGGRLSSVVDLTMKEGNAKHFGLEGTIGLATTGLTIEGPISIDRTSFIVSARRSFVDVAAKSFAAEGDVPDYALLDVNAKINHRLSSSDRVFASFYGGSDSYQQLDRVRSESDGGSDAIRTLFNIEWGNVLSTVRWNRLYSSKLFSNVTLFYSRYHLRTQEQDVRLVQSGSQLREDRFQLRYDSGVRDAGFKVDVDFVPSPAHYLRFGAHLTQHAFRTGSIQTRETGEITASGETVLAPIGTARAVEADLYGEDDWTVSPRFSANIGVHISGYAIEATPYASVQPRLSLRWLAAPTWALKGSYSSMAQYVHLLVNSGLGLPTDLWLPATARARPLHSRQVAIGLTHTIGNSVEASIEAYSKTMNGLIEYAEGANYLGAGNDWQDKVEVGTGRAEGVEILVQKRTGPTVGWIGYTLSRSDRRFDSLNGGRTFPFRYDRTHDVVLTITHRFSQRLSLSTTWVYATGSAVSIGVRRFSPAVFDDDSGPRVIYSPNSEVVQVGDRNGFRMPAYHRLDLSAEYDWTRGGREHSITLGMYNSYNRKNPYFLFADDVPVVENDLLVGKRTVVKQASLFPILPSLSYSFRF